MINHVYALVRELSDEAIRQGRGRCHRWQKTGYQWSILILGGTKENWEAVRGMGRFFSGGIIQTMQLSTISLTK